MALIDRLKYDPSSDEELVHREAKDNLTVGTQLIVNESQEAVFVKGGAIAEIFGPGTHTLSTANIPILQGLVNLPFGGQTPFTAEIFYVNRRAKLDLPWGTTSPMLLVDPQFGIPVPVRAYGQFGLSVGDSRTFVTRLVGALKDGLRMDVVESYFKGLLVSRVKESIAKFVIRERTPILALDGLLGIVADELRAGVEAEFASYGLTVLNFYVMSITVPQDDESVRRLRDILTTKAEFEQMGANYSVKRSFDVLEKAAANESGVAGSLLAGGLGLGIGLGAGPALGQGIASAMTLGSVACPSCGSNLTAGAKFCSSCGAKRS